MRRALVWAAALVAAFLALPFVPGASEAGESGTTIRRRGYLHGGPGRPLRYDRGYIIHRRHYAPYTRRYSPYRYYPYDRRYPYVYDPFYDPFYDPWYGPYRYPYLHPRERAERRPDGELWDAEEAARLYAASSSATGWEALASGRFDEAVGYFTAEVEQHPNQGAPRIGRALALASRGDDARAVGALRAALRDHPLAAHTLPLGDESLRERLRALLAHYGEGAESELKETDAAYLRSALHAFLGELPQAREALEESRRAGVDDASTVGLYRVIVTAPPPRVEEGTGAGEADRQG